MAVPQELPIALDRNGVDEPQGDLHRVIASEANPKRIAHSAAGAVQRQIDRVGMAFGPSDSAQPCRLIGRVVHSGGLRFGSEQVGAKPAGLEPAELRDRLVFLPLADGRLGNPEKAGDLGVGASPERFPELTLGHWLAVHGATLRPLNASVKSAKAPGV